MGEPNERRRGSDPYRQHTDTDTNANPNGHTDSYSDSNRNTDCHGYTYSEAYAFTEVLPDATASDNSAAKTLMHW